MAHYLNGLSTFHFNNPVTTTSFDIADKSSRKADILEENLNFSVGLESWVKVDSKVMATGIMLSMSGLDSILQKLPATSLTRQAFDRFVWWRGVVEIKAVITGNPFQAGLGGGAVFFYPEYTGDADHLSGTIFAAPMKHIVPYHVSGEYLFKIPFMAPFDYLYIPDVLAGNKSSMYDYFTFIFGGFYTPTAGIDAPVVSFFVRFPDAEFKVPKLLANPAPPLEETFVMCGIEQQGVGPSKVNNYNYSFENSPVGSVPLEISEVAHQTTAQVDTTLPMDKPPVAGGCIPVKTQMSSMANTVGKTVCYSMQAHPAAMARNLDAYNTPVNLSDLNVIMSRESRVTSIAWTTAAATGAVLSVLPICPMVYAASDAGTGIAASIMEVFADLFSFWRGSFTVRVYTTANNFHTGMLRFSMAYGLGTPEYNPSVGSTALDMVYNHNVDISTGLHVYEFEIPYKSAYQYLRMPNCVRPTYKLTTGEDYPLDPGITLGNLVVSVVNPLRRANTAVTDTLGIAITMVYSGNFYVPRGFGLYGPDIPLVYTPILKTPKLTGLLMDSMYDIEQQGVTGEDESDQTLSTSEVGQQSEGVVSGLMTTGGVPPKIQEKHGLMIGDHLEYPILSISELFKRYTPAHTVTTLPVTVTVASKSVLLGRVYFLTWTERWLSWFAGFKGSLHVRMHFNSLDSRTAFGDVAYCTYWPNLGSGSGGLPSSEGVRAWLAYLGVPPAASISVGGEGYFQDYKWNVSVASTAPVAALDNIFNTTEAHAVSGAGVVDFHLPYQEQRSFVWSASKEGSYSSYYPQFLVYVRGQSTVDAFYTAAGDDFTLGPFNGYDCQKSVATNIAKINYNVKNLGTEAQPEFRNQTKAVQVGNCFYTGLYTFST